MAKKWTIITLSIIFLFLLLVSLTVVIIDPFFYFHKPIMGKGYVIDEEVYQNPGIIKNFDYDTIITGSSMTQNTKASDVDYWFDANSVKTTFSAAHGYDYNMFFKIALKSEDLKLVVWGLDPYSFIQEIDTNRYTLPVYFYDENPFNDISYILNKGSFMRSLGVIKRALKGEENVSRDRAYNWLEKFDDNFDEQKVLKKHLRLRTDVIGEPRSKDYFLKNAKANMEVNILPIIKDNPEIDFEIFFPPYSILYWDTMIVDGTLEAMIELEKYIIEIFLKYDNVKIHYMQSNDEIITNIKNYMDYAHYLPEINTLIIESMGKEEYLLTRDNYEAYLNDMYELASNYDYDVLFSKFE